MKVKFKGLGLITLIVERYKVKVYGVCVLSLRLIIKFKVWGCIVMFKDINSVMDKGFGSMIKGYGCMVKSSRLRIKGYRCMVKGLESRC
jgi:hypothetical protein